MPRLVLLTLFFLLPLFVYAQKLEDQKCGFQYVIEQQETKAPGFKNEVQNFLQNTLPQLSQTPSARNLPAVIQIPVVVHIIHFGEALGTGRNLSDDRVYSQIDILNNDYQRMNADASQTPFQFQSVAANTEIEFCLAKTDEFGSPTTGIIRHQYGAIPSINYIEDVVKPSTTWNPDKYLNIWSIGLPNNDLLGYSYLPTPTMVGSTSDGVVINYLNFGYINANNRGRTAVHEVGHYLGLPHIWGQDDANGSPIGCSSDDGISDTPNADAPYYGCPGTSSSCGSGDMSMNFMDYSDDHCMNLFTEGQKNVMQGILNGIRSELAQNGSSQCQNNCYDVSVNDFNMGFESNQSFSGWVIEDANSDNTSWQFGQQTGNDWGPYNGEGMAIYFWNQDGVTPADDYLFSPCFQVKKDHAYRLLFTYACAQSGNQVFDERLEVGFSETQSSNDFYTLGSNWVMDPINNPYPDYNFKTFIFISNANSTVSIGLHVISDADKYALQIDDIKIEDLGSTVSNKEIIDGSSIAVFPNPTNGIFAIKIELEKSENLLELTLYDMLGQLVEHKKLSDVSADQVFFDMSDKEPGMYFLNINGEHIQHSQKILLSK